MNKVHSIVIIFLALVLTTCTDQWENHYEKTEPSAKGNLWDTLQNIDRYSEFVKYLDSLELDTIVNSSNPKSLFLPSNEAFNDYMSGDTAGFNETMRHHISRNLFLIQQVRTRYNLLTFSEKYAYIENKDNTFFFDGIEILNTSHLYGNGKYYEIAEVATPLPNILQYLRFNNPAFSRFIATKDSVVLDKEKSKPLGFNEKGQTIYDSVKVIINIFEEDFFKISEESRSLKATMAIPSREQYDAALDAMADELDASVASHEDVPVEWQNNVLVPAILEKGLFGGLLEPSFFQVNRGTKITNVAQDSIYIDYEIDPNSRFTASNGYIYNYLDFAVGDSLFKENTKEGETLVEKLGPNNYIWDDDEATLVEGDVALQPTKPEIITASNDSVMDLSLGVGYTKPYIFTFNIRYVFPGTYRAEFRGSYRTSGVWNIYMNGDKVVDAFDTFDLQGEIFSVNPNIYKFYPEKGFNRFDFEFTVENYGNVKLRFEYVEPGQGSDNGLNMDYIGLFPKNY